MRKNKSTVKSKTLIKWPTREQVDLRELQHKAKGAIEKDKKRATDINKLIRMDAATRLPMPTMSALSEEIRKAHAAPKLAAGSEEAKKDKVNYEQNNRAWDQIVMIRSSIAMVIGVPSLIAPFTRDYLARHIPDSEKKVFSRICRTLAQDVAEFIQLLNNIYERHEGKTGSAIGFDDQELSRQVFAEYVNVFELWMHASLPVIEHLSALLQAAISSLELVEPETARGISAKINEITDEMGRRISSLHAAMTQGANEASLLTPVEDTPQEREAAVFDKESE